MTLNDTECPIQLKLRFMDGTLDVRTMLSVGIQCMSDAFLADTVDTIWI